MSIPEHIKIHEILKVRPQPKLDKRYVNVTGDTMEGDIICQDIYPDINEQRFLGSPTRRFYSGDIRYLSCEEIKVAGICKPDLGGKRFLGSSLYYWGELYSQRAYVNEISERTSGNNINLLSTISIADDKFIKIGKDSDGVLPTPSADYRGKMIMIEGGSGVADKLYICLKSSLDTYSWVVIASG